MESDDMNATVSRFMMTTCTIALALALMLITPVAAQDEATTPDTSMVLKGGEEGTVFKSLTVEGEDRVRIEFERPSLRLDLDPTKAPGLDWDSTWEVLGRSAIDFTSPLIRLSAYEPSPYLPRPWLEQFVSGDVVRFRPALKDVDRWQLTIADSRSRTVAVFEGKGKPPEELGWDGRSVEGDPMPPGLTYSYVLEAYDRAGNKRNFVGKGFELPSYQLETKEKLVLMFSGRELRISSSRRYGKKAVPPPILLDAASRLNQTGRADQAIRVEATARTYDEANNLAQNVVQTLKPLLLGDPNRIQYFTEVQPDAPARGTVAIVVSR